MHFLSHIADMKSMNLQYFLLKSLAKMSTKIRSKMVIPPHFIYNRGLIKILIHYQLRQVNQTWDHFLFWEDFLVGITIPAVLHLRRADFFPGLLSLAVEFFRTKTHVCKSDSGSLIYLPNFVYGNTTCGLVCSVDDGPFSPMRQDAANNIYVIPAPTRLTFGTVTLLCAACCIPAILTLISMWNKILEINWKSRYGVPT